MERQKNERLEAKNTLAKQTIKRLEREKEIATKKGDSLVNEFFESRKLGQRPKGNSELNGVSDKKTMEHVPLLA